MFLSTLDKSFGTGNKTGKCTSFLDNIRKVAEAWSELSDQNKSELEPQPLKSQALGCFREGPRDSPRSTPPPILEDLGHSGGPKGGFALISHSAFSPPFVLN